MPSVVQTIGDRCRRCYHCVRHCPAKAIKVVEGQATVVEERCIACGNCFRVCAQHAKEIERAVETVAGFLAAGGEVVAAPAPSWPAAFHPLTSGQFVAALRRLGFTRVVEVAFGADLVARRYQKLVAESDLQPLLASPCPALVAYVEKFVPELVPHLAPIVSPMIALGRALKQKHWPEARVVFIGPCTAKKNELRDADLAGAVDAALTFAELREMLESAGLDPAALPPSDWDQPRAATGRVFPVPGGLLRTAAIAQDVLDNDILVTEGMLEVQRLLEEMRQQELEARFVDVLFCEGCIRGPVMASETGEHARKELVADYVHQEPHLTGDKAEAYLSPYDDVDLSRRFSAEPIEQALPSEEEIQAVLAQVNKLSVDDELNCGACGYSTCREKAIAVCQGLAEVEMCLPYLIDKTQKALEELTTSHAALANAQEKLVQAEKLAAVGQLAAGVAHQVNNPLATVLLYSHLLLRHLPLDDPRHDDLETIANEANRCKSIILALLNFARQDRLLLSTFDLSELLHRVLTTTARAVGNIAVVTDLAPDLPPLTADADQLTQVLNNIIENACEAMADGGRLTVTTRLAEAETVTISLADTGPGVSPEALPHVFDPFFTTKPMGQGTGLGLALARGIVKMHHGDLTVANSPTGGAVFTITLPLQVATEETNGGAIG